MERVHVKKLFSVFVPFDSSDEFVPQTESEPNFGFYLVNHLRRVLFSVKLFCKKRRLSQEYEQQGCISWATRSPLERTIEQQQRGLLLQLKIKQGVFDFRKVDKRFSRLQIDCISSEGQVINSATSAFFQVLPRKRNSDIFDLDNTGVIPTQWHYLDNCTLINESPGHILDALSTLQSSCLNTLTDKYSSFDEEEINSLQRFVVACSSEEYEVQSNINSSESEPQLYMEGNNSTEGELSLLSYANDEMAVLPQESEQYIVLYNGNAEVVGNFRALNFYKASDINIKEDIRLLVEDDDPRSVLLKIDGVSYKFKHGVTRSANKRFVGYIAQQIESVVPEAVELIDGILHVDYESLIPYLSESIKRNFDDVTNNHKNINSVKLEQDRIKMVVDMLYEDFLKRETAHHAQPSSREGKVQQRTSFGKMILWPIVAVLVLSVISVGVILLLNQSYPVASDNPSTSTPLPPDVAVPVASVMAPVADIEPDRQALEEFYVALNGDQWTAPLYPPPKKAWLSNNTVCKWTGVDCDSRNRVSSIRLIGANLQGTLPESIGSLTFLEELALGDNNISGVIPNSIGNLKFLRDINLSNNNPLSGSLPNLPAMLLSAILRNCSITGTIPTSVVNLEYLKILDMSYNQLSGTIPTAVVNLKYLQICDMSYNRLSGTIPTFSLGRGYELRINLSNNKLEGTLPKFNVADDASFITKLQLGVANNSLHGTLENLSSPSYSIEMLTLENNNFTGEVVYFDTSQLQMLFIDHNKFTSFNSSAPMMLDNDCDASNNEFACPIPDWLKQLCQATCI